MTNDGPCLCGDPGCGRCFPQPYGTNFKRKTIKLKRGRKRRSESKRVKSVRPQVVARDGYCRIQKDLQLNECEGKSEWAHLPDYTRAKTRKMSPEQRHSTEWTIMACTKHHDQIDGRRKPKILVAMPDPEGADGLLLWQKADIDKIRTQVRL